MLPRPGFSGVAMSFWLAATFFCKYANITLKTFNRFQYPGCTHSPNANTVNAGNRTYFPVHFLPYTPAAGTGNVY